MHDVISAFLDNEPFDSRELADALASTEGRELMLDMVAMRALVQVADESIAAVPNPETKNAWRGWALAAAAVLVASLAGYGVGRQVEPAQPTVPEATAVFTFEPGVNWSETTPAGGN
jgi:hypothetical protein